MSRFWMVQQWMAFLTLIYIGVFGRPWWVVALVSLWFVHAGVQFSRAAKRDNTIVIVR